MIKTDHAPQLHVTAWQSTECGITTLMMSVHPSVKLRHRGHIGKVTAKLHR